MGTTSPPSELLAGRFLLREVLGRGGMATVYRAFDRHLRVPRAIKVMHPHLVGRKARQRLSQEAQLMARLVHPNVVTLFELGEEQDRLFLVMELVEGGTVADRTARWGALPPKMACQVELGLLAALGCAHEQGIVHRDVKPHNILLDRAGTPRVSDFGIARWEDSSLTRTGAVMGTLAYMPPEQKVSARQVDARSDLYSAGATLYAMLTGTDPHDLFAASLNPAVAEQQLAPIPEPLRAWLLRATSFRPEDRYASAPQMAQALQEAMERLPPDPESPPLVSAPPTHSQSELDSELDLLRAEPTATDLRPALASPSRVSRALFGVGFLGLFMTLVPLVTLLLGLSVALGYVWLRPVPVTPVAEAPTNSRWQILRDGEQLVATLPAEQDVTDGDGHLGRPTLRLRCATGILEATLDTGLRDVALSRIDPTRQVAAVSVQTDGAPERRLFAKDEQTPGLLHFMADRKLTQSLLHSPGATFTYESAVGTLVTATFLPENRDLFLELDAACP